ncbi:MAG: CoA pyrophosphatase [Desulfuromonas sp.]|nr:MAG: CoA pyrophosphatase [Desulfuromonas sp.]
MAHTTITLNDIERELTRRRPTIASTEEKRRASVAMLLNGTEDDLHLLFIERAKHPEDPWSGNLAFPGGRKDKTDSSTRATAERETVEELDLDPTAGHFLGRLDDIEGAYLPVVIACFVYYLPKCPSIRPNHEVADYFWFPLSGLLDERRHKTRPLFWHGEERTIRGIDLGKPNCPILWGITYRLVIQLLTRLGRLPECLSHVTDD